MSKAKITVLVETKDGIITGEAVELRYQYPDVLSRAVAQSLATTAKLLEARLEGVR